MDIVSFVKSFPIVHFDKQETLLHHGEQNTKVYAVREGFLKVTTADEVGRDKLLWIAGRYDIVPLEQLFTDTPAKYVYSGFSQGSAYAVDKKALLAFVSTKPNILQDIARSLGEQCDDVLTRLHAAEQSDIRSKLLHVIHHLGAKFSSSDVVALHALGLNLTHQDLADMIGATREAVSIELAKLREDGVIEYTRSTFIVYMRSAQKYINSPAL